MVHQSLLDAADSYPPAGASENRLTEIVAAVLRTSPQLTSWLLRQAFHPESPESQAVSGQYDVSTQFILPSTAERPDMRIKRPSQPSLFVENKLDALYTAAQKNQYRSAVPGSDRIVAIVKKDRAHESPFELRTTWSDLYLEIRHIGRNWAANCWPDRAWKPDAPAEYRLLAELATYLQRELGLVDDPITHNDLELLPRAKAVLTRWDQLFHRVEEALRMEPGLDASQQHGEEWEDSGHKVKRTLGWDLHLQGDWPALTRHWETAYESGQMSEAQWEDLWQLASLIMAPDITWSGTPSAEPAVGVGVSVPYQLEWPPGLQEGDPLRAAAETAGFTFGTTYRGRVGRVFQTLELGQVANDDTTLEHQADHIISWARTTLRALASVTGGT
jgi:hypothetical protein